MKDAELVTKCAKKMGFLIPGVRRNSKGWTGFLSTIYCETKGGGCIDYNPLTDDAQNAALDDVILKHGEYAMRPDEFVFWSGNSRADTDFEYKADMTLAENRRRARVLCVAGLK